MHRHLTRQLFNYGCESSIAVVSVCGPSHSSSVFDEDLVCRNDLLIVVRSEPGYDHVTRCTIYRYSHSGHLIGNGSRFDQQIVREFRPAPEVFCADSELILVTFGDTLCNSEAVCKRFRIETNEIDPSYAS